MSIRRSATKRVISGARSAAARAASRSVCSWLTGSSLMPSAKLVIAETAATRSPQCRATIVSWTVDMPTASAPSVWKARISAGVSKLGPRDREVDALEQLDADRVRGRPQARAQLGVVGVAQAREARAELVVVGPGQHVGAGQVDVVLDQHQPARAEVGAQRAGGVGQHEDLGAGRLSARTGTRSSSRSPPS